MDLIEPYLALMHDRINLNVNNLLKYCQILRPIDKYAEERFNKMTNIRGWKQTGHISVLPELHLKYYTVLLPLLRKTVLYIDVSNKMKTINGVQIISIEEIRNPFLEETYEGTKKLIKKQCTGANPNIQELFHGTKQEEIDGITEDDFDDRYFNANGVYDHGAYFVDDPQKSHGYTALDPNNNNKRLMYYNKVILGNRSILTAANSSLVSVTKTFHSVIKINISLNFQTFLLHKDSYIEGCTDIFSF